MSNVDLPTNSTDAAAATGLDAPAAPISDKGKGRVKPDDAMDEDEEDDDDDEEEEDEEEAEEDDDMEDEEELAEINPEAILPTGRRTRGVKVDYTSAEAIQKAGLENDAEGDEEDEFVAKDNEVKAD